MKLLKHSFPVITAVFGYFTSMAQPVAARSDEAKGFFSFGLSMDQDLFSNLMGLDEDRNYTMGFAFFYANSNLKSSWLTAPLRWTSKKLWPASLHLDYQKNDGQPFMYSLMLANGSFTPDALHISVPIYNDRPYSNITYLQFNQVRVDNNKAIKHSSSLIVGMLGTYISREVQTEIHEWFNENDSKHPRTPRGWHHQVSNGGEPTLGLTRASDYLITKSNFQNQAYKPFSAELKHGWKYYVGYYTGLQYAFNLRLGKLDPNNWIYEVNPLTNSNRNIAAPADDAASSLSDNAYSKRTKPEIFLLASGRPVFMLYNALLNGQFRSSDRTISFRNMRHLIFEWDLGVAGRIPLSSSSILDIKWRILSGRTAEFKLPGSDTRTHYWGGIDLVFTHYK